MEPEIEIDDMMPKAPRVEEIKAPPLYSSPPFRVEIEIEPHGLPRVRLCVEGDELDATARKAMELLWSAAGGRSGDD